MLLSVTGNIFKILILPKVNDIIFCLNFIQTKTVPNKEMQDFFDVFSYVKNPEKTDNGEFVSAINCLKETALQQMIRKLDEITAQVRYMSEHDISTLSDLHADREKNQTEMDMLTDYRRHLQNKIRRASPAEKETLREEKNGVTEQITELRKRLKYADGIEKRSAHIDDCLNQIHDTAEKQRSNQNGRAGKTDRRREESLR